MKNIFKTETINELNARIERLNGDAKPKWGKMNLYQMLKHCTENELMMLEEKRFSRRFLGRIFGKLALKSIVKDEKELKRNSPTHPVLIIKENGDFEKQKQLWMEALNKYPAKTASDYTHFIHPFFGKMTKTEINILAYKHIDHHLRQFGV